MELEGQNSLEALDLECEGSCERVFLSLNQSAAGAELLALAALCDLVCHSKVDVVLFPSRESLSRESGLQRAVLSALSDYGVRVLFTEDFGYQKRFLSY